MALRGKRKERKQEGEVRVSKELEKAEVFKRSWIVVRTPEKERKEAKMTEMIKMVKGL